MEKITKISKNKAVELINNTNGKIFTVSFLNKAQQVRTINGRLKKTTSTKGGRNNATELGYITMWSMQDKGYRNVNKQTLTGLKTAGQSFNIG